MLLVVGETKTMDMDLKYLNLMDIDCVVLKKIKQGVTVIVFILTCCSCGIFDKLATSANMLSPRARKLRTTDANTHRHHGGRVGPS